MNDYISKEVVIKRLDKLCDRVCQYSKSQRYVMCVACPLGCAFDVIEGVPETNIGEWISVKDRLPEEHTRVIGYMAWKAITAIEFQNGKWYSIDHLEPLPDEAVTHWMPLPEPPEED